jgi:hypothetical protein
MSKFARLKKFNISDRTARVPLPEVGEEAALIVKSTGQFNKGYFNAVLKVGGKEARKKSIMDDLTLAEVKKDREKHVRLYEKHVIVGWEGVVDENGDLVEFTPDNLRDLMDAILEDAPHLFDRVRDVADDSANFYEDDELPPDAEELAGNSASGSSGS